MTPSIIALIPARSCSERIKNKNIRILDRHPLIAYAIQVALESQIFTRVIVSTDSEEIARIAKYYGAEIPFLRPKKYAGSTSPDIEWVAFTLKKLAKKGILIRDCRNFPGLSDRFIRVAVRKRQDNNKLIEALRQTVGERTCISR